MIKSKWILVFIIPLLVVGCRNEERAREAKLKYSLGVSYFQERKLNEAREAFEKAVQLNPKYYEARLALSNVYFEMQRGEDAIREIKKAIRIEPTKAQPHQLLSHIYFSFGRFDDVLEELERAIVLEPGNLDPRLQLVSFLLDVDVFQDVERAKLELEEMLRMAPNMPEVHHLMGMALLNLGQFREAAEKFQYILERFPNIFETFYSLGIANLRSGEYQKAIEPLKSAIKLNPKSLEAKWVLHLAMEGAGKDPLVLEKDFRLVLPSLKAAGPVVRFKDVAKEAGVAKVDQGRGSAWADFDLDGNLDLFTVGVRTGTALFRNKGDGTFVDVTDEAGVSDSHGGWASLFADYDNDGDPDLYITRDAWEGKGRNTLFRNEGNGTFKDVTEFAGVGDKEKSSFTASFGDYDNDGYLDLLVAGGLQDGQSPNSLFHNNGDGTFTDEAEPAGLKLRGPAIGSTFGDYDDDGYLDIHIVHVNGNNILYRNNGDGTFKDVTKEAGALLPIERGFVTFFFDYDNDGDLDLFTSSMSPLFDYVQSRTKGRAQTLARQALLMNKGDGTFKEVTLNAGLYLSFGSMGANYGDYDYDGDLDIYLANGGPPVGRMEPNALFRNNGDGTFTEITEIAGVGNMGKGHGVTFVDYDRDGDLDIYCPIGGHFPADRTPNSLYQNPGTGNNYLIVRTVGTRSNRDGIGAKVKVASGSLTLFRVVDGGSGFGSTNSLELEFGLGKREKVDLVEILWPSGLVETYKDIGVNQLLIVTEGKGTEEQKLKD
jgi:tetratricopeptide (TPR) repeat protein